MGPFYHVSELQSVSEILDASSFPNYFVFWLLPKTHPAFSLKALYLDNAVLVRLNNVAFHLSVKHLVAGQYWMSWITAISYYVNSHVLRAVTNTLKAAAQLHEDRNKLADSSGFMLVPSVISSGFCYKSWSHLQICFCTCLAKIFGYIFKCLYCYMPLNNSGICTEIFFFRCPLSTPTIQGKASLQYYG